MNMAHKHSVIQGSHQKLLIARKREIQGHKGMQQPMVIARAVNGHSGEAAVSKGRRQGTRSGADLNHERRTTAWKAESGQKRGLRRGKVTDRVRKIEMKLP